MRTFLLQRYTAIALLVFLTLHMVVVHYPPGEIHFSNIADRLDNPLWKAIDILFLLTVLVHALTGAYMVLTDVERFDRFKRALAGIAVIAGVVLFIYGTQTILAF